LRTSKAPDRPARGLSFGGLSAQRPADQPPGLVVPKEIDDVAHTDRLAHFPGAGPTRPRIWLTSPRMAVWRRHVPPRTARAAASRSAARSVRPPGLAGPPLRSRAEVPSQGLGLPRLRRDRVGGAAPLDLGRVRGPAEEPRGRRLPL